MNQVQARRRIDRFTSLSPGHRALALQAALPAALTPDLLYRLWANFQRDATPARALLEMPWIAVADLLLSNLCEETGYEQYELVAEVRSELLAQLAADPRLGLARIWELADFIQQYVRRQLEIQVTNPQLDLARVQQINALAYTSPDEALNELLGAYQRIGTQGGAELLRMASLVDKIAAPAQAAAAGQNPAAVAGFEQLKTFAGGLSMWVSGDAAAARDRLERAFGPEFVVQIGSVRLDVPPELVSYTSSTESTLPLRTDQETRDENTAVNTALQDLIGQVQRFETSMAVPPKTSAVQILADFASTQLVWTSPTSALYRLDLNQYNSPDLDPQQRYAFYVGVFSLNILTGQDGLIGKISLQFDVKSSLPEFEAVITDLFPTAEWERSVLSGATFEIGVTPTLKFNIKQESGLKDQSIDHPPSAGTLTSFGEVPAYGFFNGKISTNSSGSQTAAWQFDHLDLRQASNISLGVIIRTGVGARQLRAAVEVVAEPNFSWLMTACSEILELLDYNAQNLLTGKKPGLRISLADTWDFQLPSEPQKETEQIEPLDDPLPGEAAIDTLLRRLRAAAKTGAATAEAVLKSVERFQDSLHIDMDSPVPGENGFLQLSPTILAESGLPVPEDLQKEFSAGRVLFSLVLSIRIKASPPFRVDWMRLELTIEKSKERLSFYSMYPSQPGEDTWQKAGIDSEVPYRLLLTRSSNADRLALATAFADQVGAGPLIDLARFRLAHNQARLILTEGEASPTAAWEIQQPAAAESLYTVAVLFTLPSSLQTLDLRANVTVRPAELFTEVDGLAAQIQRLATGLDQPLFRKESFGWQVTPPAAPAPRPTHPDDLAVSAAKDGLALRAQPWASAIVLDRLPRGSFMRVLEPRESAHIKLKTENGWLLVRTVPEPGTRTRAELTGFVVAGMTEDIPLSSLPTPPPTNDTEPLLGYTTGDGAALRSVPEETGKIITQLTRGTVLELLDPLEDVSDRIGTQGQWLHVRVRPTRPAQKIIREGYVAGPFVSSTPPASQAKPSSRPVSERQRPAPVRSQVLLVVYNPRLPSRSKEVQTLIENRNYANPADLAKKLADVLHEVSYGYAQFEIAGTVTRDELPPFEGGFRFTIQDYLQVLDGKEQPRQASTADYAAMLKSLSLVDRLNARELDEIWVMGPPRSGLYESRMIGPKAFAVNSPGLPTVSGLKRSVLMMGFNYERGLGEMLEAFGHRAEAILQHTFDTNRAQTNLWQRFIQVKATAAGAAHPEVGTMHLAPNSRAEYDWSNPEPVPSGCDAWLDFPELKAPLRPVNCDEWGGDMIGHHRWWFKHLPCAPGRTGSLSNNWWEYILDPVQQHLPPIEGKRSYK